jgi:hypothetical protein
VGTVSSTAGGSWRTGSCFSLIPNKESKNEVLKVLKEDPIEGRRNGSSGKRKP